jgi:hypothetical protein
MGVLVHLIRTARRYGEVNAKTIAYFLAYWFLPSDTLRRLRGALR